MAFTLCAFLVKHRSSFNTLERCVEYVLVELPNQRTRVGYLIENIDSNDKDVTTTVSHVWLDDNPGGIRNNF